MEAHHLISIRFLLPVACVPCAIFVLAVDCRLMPRWCVRLCPAFGCFVCCRNITAGWTLSALWALDPGGGQSKEQSGTNWARSRAPTFSERPEVERGRGGIHTGDEGRDQRRIQCTHEGGTRGTERDTAKAAKEEISNETDIRRSKRADRIENAPVPSGPHAEGKAGSERNFQKAAISQLKRDWEAHVSAQIEDIKHHSEKGNSKELWRGIHSISGKSRSYSNQQPSADSASALRALWFAAMSKSVSATALESSREAMADIGPASNRKNERLPTDEELLICLKALRGSKACGPDDVPVEVWQADRLRKGSPIHTH